MTRSSMQVRVVTLAALVAVVFLVLGARLWHLQILSGDSYSLTAQATQTRKVKIPAQRGVIYDRDMDVLASNVPGLDVTVVPDQIERKKVRELAEIVEADVKTVFDRYDEAKRLNPYSALLVKENADRDDVTYVSERTEEFPGLMINDDWVRRYPEGGLASHVIGYTGAVTPKRLGREGSGEELSGNAIVGKSGVESTYEEDLRGEPGAKSYTVDALGRIVTSRNADGSRADGRAEISPELLPPKSEKDPAPGNNLVLTLDLELQETAERELDAAIERAKGEGFEASGGAVVAMDPRNGEILAMASRPNFDPQLFVGGITGEEEVETFEYLNSGDADSPFTNRAVAGGFPAASTFKVFTGLAGLFHGVIAPATIIADNGGCWRPSGISGGCWLSWRQSYGTGTAHAPQNLAEALGDSNDKFFYELADRLWNSTEDPNLLPKFYERFDFGELTGIDLPEESAGRVPTKDWEQQLAREIGAASGSVQWSVGDWVNLSIGQGDLLVSPLQVVRAYAALQNSGTFVTPHVGKKIVDQNGEVVEEISPESEKKLEIDPQALATTLEGLRMATGPGGTAGPTFEGSELSVLGKSGTGETGVDRDPDAWFVGWAEDQEDPLVVLVMVEHGGLHSEEVAGPAVRHILETYYGVPQSPRDPFPTRETAQ